ncbi:MAG: HD domain-containing protein [Clostridia bacterium]|nr:HD domain-containing protein [Clostridia bacterium]
MVVVEKVFRDPVHNFIVIRQPLLLDVVDTPEFQRLRRIRQLGTAATAYPGAEHSRFGHSLGVAHVLDRILSHLESEGLSLSEEERLALLAAGLLHDVGHGPFSHLWEAVGSLPAHEFWTQHVVLGETGVHRVLARYDARFPELVASVLRHEHPRRVICDLVSGQLDADRMDYLLRDALFAGASYGRFDLERLVRVLRIVDGRLAVERKGLSNVEEYLLARYFMYWRVYFHKTNRAEEVVLRNALRRAAQLCRDGAEALVQTPPSLLPLLRGEATLEQYLAVDDSDVWCALKLWRRCEDPVLADLADRVLSRRLLKPVFDESVEPFRLPDLQGIREVVARAGWDPDYYCALDRTVDVAYEHLPGEEGVPILILEEDGSVRDVSAVSPVIRSLTATAQERCNLFVPAECRETVRRGGTGWGAFAGSAP